VVSRFMLVVSAGFIVCLLLIAGLTTPRSYSSTVDPAGLVGVKATYMCPPRWEWLTMDIGMSRALAPSPAFFYKYPEVLANITKAVEQLSRHVDASKLDATSRRFLGDAINFARKLRDFDPGNGEYDIPLFSLADSLELLSMKGVVSFNTTLWWHVIGFNGSHYTVILGVNLTLSVGRKTLGYGVVEEVVQVSAQDRTMYYKGEYAGRWPFFLMPHELYEESKIELTDVILYWKYKGTEFKEVDLSATLSKRDVESSVRVIGGYFTYIKEKMGIPAERLLGGGINLALSGDTFLALHNATYSFIDELTGRKVLRAIRIQGIASVPITLGAIYDVSTGVAVEFAQGPFSASAFDPLSYVIPLSAKIGGFEGCTWFVLVDLRREEARIITTPETTVTETPKPPEATHTATAPVETQTQVTPTTTPMEVGQTPTSPPETPATPPGVTTPATQPRQATRTPGTPATQPAPPIPAIPPGPPIQAVDGGARGQEGLIAVELLTITLAVLSLTILAIVAYRILVRQK
jgi:ribosomal protein S15P/S13E